MPEGKKLKKVWFTLDKVNTESTENIELLTEFLHNNTKQKWFFINNYNNSVWENYFIFRWNDSYVWIKNIDYSNNKIWDFFKEISISKLRKRIEWDNNIIFRISTRLSIEYRQLEWYYENKHWIVFDIYKSTKLKFKAVISKDNKQKNLPKIAPIVSKFKTAILDELENVSNIAKKENTEEDLANWIILEEYKTREWEKIKIYKSEDWKRFRWSKYITIDLEELKEKLENQKWEKKKYKKLKEFILIMLVMILSVYWYFTYNNYINKIIPIDISCYWTWTLVLNTWETWIIKYEWKFSEILKSKYELIKEWKVLNLDYWESIINFTWSIEENNSWTIYWVTNWYIDWIAGLNFNWEMIWSWIIEFSWFKFLWDISNWKLIWYTNIPLNISVKDENQDISWNLYISIEWDLINENWKISWEWIVKFSWIDDKITKIDQITAEENYNKKINGLIIEKISDIINSLISENISDKVLKSTSIFDTIIKKYLKDDIILGKVEVSYSNKNINKKYISNSQIINSYKTNLKISNEIISISNKTLNETSSQILKSLSWSLYLSGSTLLFTETWNLENYISNNIWDFENIEYTTKISIEENILKNILDLINKKYFLFIKKELKLIDTFIDSINIGNFRHLYSNIDKIEKHVNSLSISNKEKVLITNLINNIRLEEQNIVQKDVTAEVIGSKLWNSIWIAVAWGIFDKIISKNTELPIIKEKDYYTSVEFQKSIDILIYEWENKYIKDNNKLWRFTINLEPIKNIWKRIKVEFNVNKEWKIFVNVIDLLNKNNNVEVEISAEINKKENITENVRLSTVSVKTYIKKLNEIIELVSK